MQKSFVAFLIMVCAAAAQAGSREIRTVDDPAAGVYIVRLDETLPIRAADIAPGLAKAAGGAIDHTYDVVMRGFAFHGAPAAAQALLHDPRVVSVQQASRIHALGTQSPAPSWGLDRIDQVLPQLDHVYNYTYTGVGAVIYIVDAGISFTNDLGGRYLAVRSTSFVPNDTSLGPNCSGTDHGTSIANIAAGATYGIAKNSQVINVRVLDCNEGYADSGTVIAGINYMVTDHQAHPGQVSIANLSLGSFGTDLELDRAVVRAVQAGVTVAVSAGNEGVDACLRSPSRTGNPAYIPPDISNPTGASSIVVGGTMMSGDQTADWYWSSIENGVTRLSNFGQCVDIFAPSYHVTTLDRFGTPYSNWWGTSMAAPHVAGVAALHVERYGGATTPGMIESVIKDSGIAGYINGLPSNTNNLELWEYVAKRRGCCF